MFEFDFRRTPVTLIIAAIAIALEVVCTFDDMGLFGGMKVSRRMLLYNQYHLGLWWQLWDGEVWRPFTSTLLHGNLLHALFNVYWLLIFGTALERNLGTPRYFGIVVLLAYVPILVQYVVDGYWARFIDPGSSVAGAVGLSGVIYGLFGIILVARQYQTEYHFICDDRIVQLMLAWLVICFALTWSGMMNVANLAHLVGLGLGWIMGKALYVRRQRVMWATLTTVVSILVLSTMIACPGHPHYEYAKAVRQQRAWQRQKSCLPAPHSPVSSATNSRTAVAIGSVESWQPLATSRTRGQSSDTNSVARRPSSANDNT